jgi:hypothetical protein
MLFCSGSSPGPENENLSSIACFSDLPEKWGRLSTQRIQIQAAREWHEQIDSIASDDYFVRRLELEVHVQTVGGQPSILFSMPQFCRLMPLPGWAWLNLSEYSLDGHEYRLKVKSSHWRKRTQSPGGIKK